MARRKSKTTETQIELRNCPFSECCGHVLLDLAHEDELHLLYTGNCSDCQEQFSVQYQKREEN